MPRKVPPLVLAQPEEACSFVEESWCPRHHVVESKCNVAAPRTRRAYFDELPRVGVRGGRYHITYDHTPPESDTLGGTMHRLEERFVRHPAVSREVLSRWNSGVSLAREASAKASCLSFGFEEAQQDSKVDNPSESDSTRHGNPAGPTLATQTTVQMPSPDGAPAQYQNAILQYKIERHQTKKRTTAAQRMAKFELAKPHIELAEWAESKLHIGLIGVWRKLDNNGNMSLSKAELFRGLKNLSFPGDVHELWKVLDNDRAGSVSFIEFDPEGALCCARFKRWTELRFGSVQKAFSSFDTARNGQVDYKEFVTACRNEDIPPSLLESLPLVFRILDDSTHVESKGNITVEEVGFLDRWKCPEYLWKEPDEMARERFKAALAAKYHNNSLLAWRKAMDKDGTMRVTQAEFEIVCRKLAHAGVKDAKPENGLAGLYVALDQDRSGWFSIRDWDERIFNLLACFVTFARAQFHKVSHCIRAWELREGKGVGLDTWHRHTKETGMSTEDLDELFEGFSMKTLNLDRSSLDEGSADTGRMQPHDLVFLDTWMPEDDLQEYSVWAVPEDMKNVSAAFEPSPPPPEAVERRSIAKDKPGRGRQTRMKQPAWAGASDREAEHQQRMTIVSRSPSPEFPVTLAESLGNPKFFRDQGMTT